MSGAEPVAPQESPGRILRSAREASGLSRREIAEALNLLESVVVAIEEDDTARQPEPVFMRGYVRNYARLLKLDPEPLVGSIGASRQPAAPVRPVHSLSERPRWIWPAAAVGAALAVLVGVVIHLLQPDEINGSIGPISANAVDMIPDNSSVSPVTSATGELRPTPEDVVDTPTHEQPVAPEPVDAFIEVENDDGPESVAEQRPDRGGLNPVSDQGEELVGESAAEPVSAASNLPAGVIRKRLNRGNRDTIRLSFTADCWVRVKDNTGRMVFSDMGRQGIELELTGNGPFDVLLGFAPAAILEWNGAAVALEPHMRNNVATLLLDRAAEAVADQDVNRQES
jgi:cytoskeleton protein RodZ